ncbi:hypothetical protein NC981_13060 [Leptolyngbya sp. DQ-M1]|uniref:hypothetical protein n=1 Tax=Leptolyngbya sp. DQ-M1 TaxID=2933920 RepID=UPI003299E5C7
MFIVNKASDEQIDRHQINQIKIELEKKFSNQAFDPAGLGLIWAGESEFVLLSANLCLQAVHINLIYAVIELYREQQLDLVELDSPKFRLKC